MKIGLFIGAVNDVFSTNIIKSMEMYAARRGVTIYAFGNFSPPDNALLHAEGEKSSLYIPNLKRLDAIVIAGDTLSRFDMREEVLERIKREAECPVIGIRYEEKDFYNILGDNENDMYRMTKHFIEVHHCKDIAFVVGRMDLPDASERLNGYKRAMQEAGLTVTDDMLYYGDYWRTHGPQIVDTFTKKDGTLPEVIICSNDFMALSVCDEVKKRGFNIPKDVMISGFDDLEESQMYIPPLTSVDADYSAMGCKAVELALKLYENEEVPKYTYIDSNLKLRKSCGCNRDKVEYNKDIYMGMINKSRKSNVELIYMAADFETTVTEGECFEWLKYYLLSTPIDACFICLKKQDFLSEDGVEEELQRKLTPEEKVAESKKASHEIRLRYVLEGDGHSKTEEIMFDEQDYLPPEYVDRLNGKTNIFLPIHCKNEVYGYFIFQMKPGMEGVMNERFECLSMFLGNSLKKLYMHQSLFSMKDIMRLYLKDPLTNIYNRRGFEQNFLEIYSKAKQDNVKLAVVSVDLDGLKYINDLFGHQKGDEALITISTLLSESLEEDELCARMGGDEFEAVLIMNQPNRIEKFRDEFKKRIIQANKRIKENYRVDASVGVCVIEEHNRLAEYIQYADKLMYEEKISKVDKQGSR